MGKFKSERDEQVHLLAVEFPDEEVGSVQTCAWSALVTFDGTEIDGTAGHYGAIVTEDSQGFVYVTYYGSARSLHQSWNELWVEHDECCGDDGFDWPELLFTEAS